MAKAKYEKKMILNAALANRISAYSLAAGAALAMAVPAESAVHATTPATPLQITSQNDIQLDLNGDLVPDFLIEHSIYNERHKIIIRPSGIYGSYNGFWGNWTAFGTYFVAQKFAAGNVINQVGPANSANLMSACSSLTAGWGTIAEFNNGTQGYIGVTFKAGEQTYAGWIHFTGNTDWQALSGVIDSWAYEDTGGPIKAGATISMPMKISATAASHGTINPSGDVEVAYNGTQKFEIKAANGYGIADVLVDGWPVGPVTSYTFESVNKDHAIEAQFSALPVAKAGPDQTVDEFTTVKLNGKSSSDPEGGNLSYSWTQRKGATVTIADPTAGETTFVSPNVGLAGQDLVFRLTVTDDKGLSASDDCTVHVTWKNQPPVAAAGEDKTVMEGTRVALNGKASSDPDDVVKSYKWRQINVTEGTRVALKNPDKPVAKFIAPNVKEGGAALNFRLLVRDSYGLKSTDTCIVNVTWDNDPPVARTSRTRVVSELDTVVLDGSASTDSDDGIKTYSWEQVSGTPVTLTGAGTAKATFTAPDLAGNGATLVFKLTVTDTNGLASSRQCSVMVNWVNHKPTVSKPTGGPVGGVGKPGVAYTYSVTGVDPDAGDTLQYRFDWGDGTKSAWNAAGDAGHSWKKPGRYTVRAQAKDQWGKVSGWSKKSAVSISR